MLKKQLEELKEAIDKLDTHETINIYDTIYTIGNLLIYLMEQKLYEA